MRKKIVIAGGTGFLGSGLAERFSNDDTDLVVLTRKPGPAEKNIYYQVWDGITVGDWAETLEGSTAVINLVGKSVNCRYTEKNKREIIASRVNATLALGKAINELNTPPGVWINGASEAIFGDGGSSVKNEDSLPGDGFSAGVCKIWEETFNSIQLANTRKVLLRMGLVFQRNRGLLQPFVNLAKWGMGGRIGSGNQYISWIHEADFFAVIDTILNDASIQGMMHCSSPYPVTNAFFMKTLRAALHRPFGLNHPPFLIKIGARIIGTEPELVLTGRRVVSRVLEEKKFTFQYPRIEAALNNLVH